MKTIHEGFDFDTSVSPPIFCEHVFKTDAQVFEHHADGRLRAAVPIEHMADYLRSKNIMHIGKDNPTLIAARKINTTKPGQIPAPKKKR